MSSKSFFRAHRHQSQSKKILVPSAMAVCVSMLFGRLGSVTSTNLIGFLLESYCELTYYSFSGIMFLCLAVSFLVPSWENAISVALMKWKLKHSSKFNFLPSTPGFPLIFASFLSNKFDPLFRDFREQSDDEAGHSARRSSSLSWAAWEALRRSTLQCASPIKDMRRISDETKSEETLERHWNDVLLIAAGKLRFYEWNELGIFGW